MGRLYDHYKYVYFYSAVIEFRRLQTSDADAAPRL